MYHRIIESILFVTLFVSTIYFFFYLFDNIKQFMIDKGKIDSKKNIVPLLIIILANSIGFILDRVGMISFADTIVSYGLYFIILLVACVIIMLFFSIFISENKIISFIFMFLFILVTTLYLLVFRWR